MKSKKLLILTTALITLTLVLSSLIFANAQKSEQTSSSSLTKISDKLKSTFKDYSPDEVKRLVINQYKKMRLIDKDGNWADKKIENISDSLLPDNISAIDFENLLDKATECASRNQYLINFLEKADYNQFTVLKQKFETEGKRVIPDVMAYAYVLNAVTKSMYEDYHMIAVYRDIWVSEREKENVLIYLDEFEKAKLPSVELPINNYIKALETGNIDPNREKRNLALNIMEATATDFIDKRFDNERTGWTLAVFSNTNKYDATPIKFLDDMKGISYGLPLAKKYDDLYATWNLCFVSKYQHFPYVFVKLLIPQVNDYGSDPQKYIYNRALALYTHLNYSFIGRADAAKQGLKTIEWHDPNLTLSWGKENKNSAISYEEEIAKLDPTAKDLTKTMAPKFSEDYKNELSTLDPRWYMIVKKMSDTYLQRFEN